MEQKLPLHDLSSSSECRQTHFHWSLLEFCPNKIIHEKPLISVPGAPFPQARLRANRTLVRKTLSHDVTILVFLPFADRRKNGFSARAFPAGVSRLSLQSTTIA